MYAIPMHTNWKLLCLLCVCFNFPEVTFLLYVVYPYLRNFIYRVSLFFIIISWDSIHYTVDTDGSLVIDLNNISNSTDPALTALLGDYTCRFRDAANGVDKPIDTSFTFNYTESRPLFHGTGVLFNVVGWLASILHNVLLGLSLQYFNWVFGLISRHLYLH